MDAWPLLPAHSETTSCCSPPLDILSRDETWINRGGHAREVLSGCPKPWPTRCCAQASTSTSSANSAEKGDNQADEKRRLRPRRSGVSGADRPLHQAAGGRRRPRRVHQRREGRRGTQRALVKQIREAVRRPRTGPVLRKALEQLPGVLTRARFFKDWVEHNDGYRLFNGNGKTFSKETDVQLAFGARVVQHRLRRQPRGQQRRGPVDFKVSYGARDKSLIELSSPATRSSNAICKKQVKIYEAANQTWTSARVIMTSPLPSRNGSRTSSKTSASKGPSRSFSSTPATTTNPPRRRPSSRSPCYWPRTEPVV